MSNAPRTVASLEFATILFILKGDRCLRRSSPPPPTIPLFPCSPGGILTTTRRQLASVSVLSEEDRFPRHIASESPPPLPPPLSPRGLAMAVPRVVARLLLHSRRFCGPPTTSDREGAGRSTRTPARRVKREEMCMWIVDRGAREARGGKWEEKTHSGRRLRCRRQVGLLARKRVRIAQHFGNRG